MEDLNPNFRSSSAKIDKIVCQLVIHIQDLSRASQPDHKQAEREYYRALKCHNSLKEQNKFEEIPLEVQYKIDKAVRDRLKDGYFGYDHSQLLGLRVQNTQTSLELDESSIRNLLIPNIYENQFYTKLSYQQWKRKKETEDRIKNNLKMKLYREFYEQDLIKQQNDEEKLIESQKKVKSWLRNKIKQSAKHKREIIREKYLQEEIKKEKDIKADENYRNWLREKLIKANEEILRKKKLNKKRRELRKKEKEKEIELKLQREQVYQEWLMSKSKHNTSRLSSTRKVFKKSKKPFRKLSANQENYQRDTHINRNVNRPPLPRTSLRVEEFNSFLNIENKEENGESSMSFISESYESV
jgi:hypothetical protein